MAEQEGPEIGARNSSRNESAVLWSLMWSGIFWGLTQVTRSDQPPLKFSASSGSESLDSDDVSSYEWQSRRIKSFSSSPSEVDVPTVLEESLSEDVVSLSGSALAWRFPFLALLPVG